MIHHYSVLERHIILQETFVGCQRNILVLGLTCQTRSVILQSSFQCTLHLDGKHSLQDKRLLSEPGAIGTQGNLAHTPAMTGLRKKSGLKLVVDPRSELQQRLAQVTYKVDKQEDERCERIFWLPSRDCWVYRAAHSGHAGEISFFLVAMFRNPELVPLSPRGVLLDCLNACIARRETLSLVLRAREIFVGIDSRGITLLH